MAVPSDMSISNLQGSWLLGKEISSDPDEILKLQGLGWLLRKAIRTATLTLRFTSWLEPYPDSSQPTVHLVADQLITGGISGSTEHRTMDWAERNHKDNIFGDVIARARLIDGVLGTDGVMRPDLNLQSRLSQQSDIDHVKNFLKGFSLAGTATESEDLKNCYMHDFIQNKKVGWTVEQVWGFDIFESSRYLTRRIVVVKGGVYETAILAYKFIE